MHKKSRTVTNRSISILLNKSKKSSTEDDIKELDEEIRRFKVASRTEMPIEQVNLILGTTKVKRKDKNNKLRLQISKELIQREKKFVQVFKNNCHIINNWIGYVVIIYLIRVI